MLDYSLDSDLYNLKVLPKESAFAKRAWWKIKPSLDDIFTQQ